MRYLRYTLIVIGVLLLIAVLGGTYVYRDLTRGPLPQIEGTLSVVGLREPVDVLRDENGIPHIYATNTHDLFFAQGYVQAQDRWWQMEFSRHTGSGSLSELVGYNEDILGIDVFVRTAGWRQSAERDFEELSPDATDIVNAFSDGVNAYIGGKAPTDLALEYGILGLTGVNFEVAPWTPIDSLVWGKVMAWDLASNRSRELAISALLDDENVSTEMIDVIYQTFPFDDMPTVLRGEEIPLLAEGETAASATSVPARYSAGEVRLAGGVPADLDIAFGHGLSLGSNNWVVNGDLTESGAPLMANDMHLSIGIPAIWYEVGLHCRPRNADCPYDVRGLALPATPSIISGHNHRIGWALTNVGPDTQDMYMMRIDDNNPTAYAWNDSTREIIPREETIEFGDDTPPLTFTVRETHLGPIMNDNSLNDDGTLSGANNDNPLAMRWTTTAEPGTLFDALLMVNQAENWDEFRAALELWDSPSQNFMYADIDGNIGYQMPGRIPLRAPDHDGFTPVPGWTDAYEWRGYVPFDLLPRTYNPERGYIGSVNQPAAPLAYYDALGEAIAGEENAFFQTQIAYGYRAVSLHRLLEANVPHTIETFQQIQDNTASYSAEQLLPFFTEMDYGNDDLNELRDWLAEWDTRYDADSARAFFYAHLWSALLEEIYSDQLPADFSTGGNERQQWATYTLMSDPENPWWDDIGSVPVETRDDILQRSFERAATAAVETGGEDRDAWRWDSVHLNTVIHNPLGQSGVAFIEDMFNRGPFPTYGTDGALKNMRWNAADSFETAGAVISQRFIVDFADFSNSVSIIPTGQSGHPFSPHYDDQLESWTQNGYHPMRWTREDVESAPHSVLVLEPAND